MEMLLCSGLCKSRVHRLNIKVFFKIHVRVHVVSNWAEVPETNAEAVVSVKEMQETIPTASDSSI